MLHIGTGNSLPRDYVWIYKALLYKMKKLGLDGHEASVRTNAHPGRDYLMQGAAGND